MKQEFDSRKMWSVTVVTNGFECMFRLLLGEKGDY